MNSEKLDGAVSLIDYWNELPTEQIPYMHLEVKTW